MAAKMAKLPQTDWTRAGHDISQTAAPLYQTNLNRMGNYLEDPMAYQQKYIDRYFGPDAIQNQDLLRQYNRAMGNATGNNYAATAGGLASSAQRAYNDQQRYYNDWVARLQGENVTNAYNMANQDYQNMLSGNKSFNDAYQLGKAYSQTEQQNALAKQANKNWLGNAVQLGATAIGAVAGGPAGAMLGNALGSAIGSQMQTNTSGALATIYGGEPSDWAAADSSAYINPYQAINATDWASVGSGIKNWWGNAKNNLISAAKKNREAAAQAEAMRSLG